MLRFAILLLAPACAAPPAAPPAPEGVERSVWIGRANGEVLYAEAADVPRPAASSIKVSYLVELFAELEGALDRPVPGAAAIVGDPAHPAIAHFDPETQAEIRDALETADVRTVGRRMIRGTGVSNAVYNAAANLTTAFLGGPAALTERIHARHPDFAGIRSRRYMLAARNVTGDNTATAESLAAVLAAIARDDFPGASELREVLFLEDTPRGRHFYKGGSLNSLPVTRVLSGFFERAGERAGAQLVYAFMGEIAEVPDPGAAGAALQRHLEELAEALP